ncbi:MAG: hypothetical protein HYU77_12580 [Betaproteobacteria bacterium]|nr:hypothetical protein [Betaproteobacteria bacterium]
MKPINVTDIGSLKNELAKYKKGRKLDIAHFNKAARLAWLGKIVLCLLDSQDPECDAYLLHLLPVGGVAAEILTLDDNLDGQPFLSRIHVLDAEQGKFLAEILEAGMRERVRDLEALNRRDFYFEKFFKPEQKD